MQICDWTRSHTKLIPSLYVLRPDSSPAELILARNESRGHEIPQLDNVLPQSRNPSYCLAIGIQSSCNLSLKCVDHFQIDSCLNQK